MILFQLSVKLRYSIVIPERREIFLPTKRSLNAFLTDRSEVGGGTGLWELYSGKVERTSTSGMARHTRRNTFPHH